jgi:hypothetical protein
MPPSFRSIAQHKQKPKDMPERNADKSIHEPQHGKA